MAEFSAKVFEATSAKDTGPVRLKGITTATFMVVTADEED